MIWEIVSPFTTIALVLLALLVFYLVYRKRLANEWEMMRVNGLKRRSAASGCHSILLLSLRQSIREIGDHRNHVLGL